MSNQYLKLRRSGVPGKIPSTSSIDYGEIALNTYDGVAYMKKSGSNGEEVVGFNSGSFTGNFSGSFSGSGANLSNIPASGIVGLNLSQISSGSFSASISDAGLLVNTRVVANSFTGSLQGTASWAQNAVTASTTTNVVGASNQLAFFNSSNSITSSANLRFVNNNASLTGSLTIQSSGTEAINLGTSATDPDQQVDIRLASGGARGIRIYASSSPLSDKPTGAGFQFYTTSSVNFPGHVYFVS